jgi:TRAP-type C4-dicarboxylate transport system substrate-binding protein
MFSKPVIRRLAAAGAAVLFAAAASAQELKFADFNAPTHPMIRHVFNPLIEDIARATNGEVKIRLYPSGELGQGPALQYKRVTDGIADFTFGLPGYTSSTFPGTLLIEMPGITQDPLEATHMLWNAFPGLIEKEFARVKVLGMWANAPAMIMTARKPVRSLDDLKGTKIRVPSAAVGNVVEAWGAAPVTMPSPAVYNALSTGVVDGILMGSSGIIPFKLHEVARYYTTNLAAGVTSFFLIMNRDSWGKLTAPQQAAIDKLTGRTVSLKAAKVYLDEGNEGIELVRRGGKGDLVVIADGELARFRAASAKALDAAVADLEKQGTPARQILQAFRSGPLR